MQEILKRLERSVTNGEADLSVARFKEAGVATKSILSLISLSDRRNIACGLYFP